jgi:hypothetical protein
MSLASGPERLWLCHFVGVSLWQFVGCSVGEFRVSNTSCVPCPAGSYTLDVGGRCARFLQHRPGCTACHSTRRACLVRSARSVRSDGRAPHSVCVPCIRSGVYPVPRVPSASAGQTSWPRQGGGRAATLYSTAARTRPAAPTAGAPRAPRKRALPTVTQPLACAPNAPRASSCGACAADLCFHCSYLA